MGSWGEEGGEIGAGCSLPGPQGGPIFGWPAEVFPSAVLTENKKEPRCKESCQRCSLRVWSRSIKGPYCRLF